MNNYPTYENLIAKILQTKNPTETFNEIRFFPIGFDGVDFGTYLRLNFPDAIWSNGDKPDRPCIAACVYSKNVETLKLVTGLSYWDLIIVLQDGTSWFIFYIVDKNDDAEEPEKQNLVSES